MITNVFAADDTRAEEENIEVWLGLHTRENCLFFTGHERFAIFFFFLEAGDGGPCYCERISECSS